MFRHCLCLFLFCVLAANQALSENVRKLAPRPLASALHAAQDDRWRDAYALAARDGAVAVVLVHWMRLRRGEAQSQELLQFIADYPHWPELARLLTRNLGAFEAASAQEVITLFDGAKPQTGRGVLLLGDALIAQGQKARAETLVVEAWRNFDLSQEEHDDFLSKHASLLRPHHEDRLRMALWRGLKDSAYMQPLVSQRARDLTQAIAQIQRGANETLPNHIARDPLVVHAKFNQLRDRDPDAAIDLLLRASQEKTLEQPQRWASWRRFLARAKMREGDAKTAYALASDHGLEAGSHYADLEWLSGYLTLRYLNNSAAAIRHFENLRGAVSSPISLGRAGYWLGRAYAANQNPDMAQEAYEFGAQYQTSFYGLMAAQEGQVPFDAGFAPRPFDAGLVVKPVNEDLFEALVLLRAAGRLSLAERFMVRLAEKMNAKELRELAAALAELRAPHLEVMLGKFAARRGIILHHAYYALHPLMDMDLGAPKELALAIARRESEFDPNVKSGAGAEGLMQLMPATAADMARDLGIPHAPERVLQNWRYNAQLGARYLSRLGDQFDGNPLLISAAYNAGPRRANIWMAKYGDPRADTVDIIDWIEHIPFRETRNYVMRVTESLPIYRARLGLDPLPVPFAQMLKGASLR